MMRALVLVLLLGLLAPLAAAHDFWLVPVGSEIEARTGSRFPASTNAITPDRLAEAVAVHPRRIDLSAKDFNAYLHEDGLPQIAELRERTGELDRPAVERYQKFA